MNKILKKVQEIDWSKYDNIDMYGMDYDPKKIPEVFDFLVNATDSDFSTDYSDMSKLIYAFGHDHAGLYYPVLLDSLDLLIEIEQTTDSANCKTCLQSLFNNFYYFSAYIGNSKHCTKEELQNFVTTRLEPYSDENLNNFIS